MKKKGKISPILERDHISWMPFFQWLKFYPSLSERNDVLREAEILHKARFSYILPILGICNEPEFWGIVTEYMPNGSLNELLHRKNEYPDVPWPLRFRILHEIALGVNDLHNMNPPLLHHDLKTQNILLDNEFHVKMNAQECNCLVIWVFHRAKVVIYFFYDHASAVVSKHSSRSHRAQAPDAQAQQPWLTCPAALRHVGSSRTGAQTRVPRISRRTLNHCATREAHKYVLYANYTIVNRYSFSGRHKSYNNELYYIGILLISKFKDTIFSTL
ncbi:uncharacterized protein LOC117199120 isoform X3 [Orcinus orca]|uniref:uncharacterized protein LOC117199120 isoform X3 n=1 Tax=Orcinus orca TaxID=9733 RepID=UPI0021116DF8|nr:uncharacterized protein LOC117199120 isoform X3 [Orcinus orca]